ncbi:MAG: FtsW/RodA/SpoVE family cell cycle protein, partial [Microcystaceae cyanobacterium]
MLNKTTILRFLIPIYDPEAASWSGEARLLRWFTFAWLLLGLIVLYSASYPEGVANYDDGFYIIKRQLLFIWLGLTVFNVIVRSPLTKLLNIAP